MVQLRSLAIFDTRLAGQYESTTDLLSKLCHGDGPRHPVFLGGADDHARVPLHGADSIQACVPARHGSRWSRAEDVLENKDESTSRKRIRSSRLGPCESEKEKNVKKDLSLQVDPPADKGVVLDCCQNFIKSLQTITTESEVQAVGLRKASPKQCTVKRKGNGGLVKIIYR